MAPDPHTPALSEFEINEEESKAIEIAVNLDNPWAHEKAEPASIRQHLKAVKDRLVEFHEERQNGTCCYCRTILDARGPFARDREHVLPKEKYKCLSYTPFNLSISCKRCNMEIKKGDIDFVVNPETILEDPKNPGRYRFVHPNFEKWEDYIGCSIFQEDSIYLVHYYIKSEHPKAAYTFNYFKLRDLSIRSFNRSQGGAELISEFRKQLEELEKEFEQD